MSTPTICSQMAILKCFTELACHVFRVYCCKTLSNGAVNFYKCLFHHLLNDSIDEDEVYFSALKQFKWSIWLSDVSVQGTGRYKETDDEGSPPPAEEG